MNTMTTAAVRRAPSSAADSKRRKSRVPLAWLRKKSALIGYLLTGSVLYAGWVGRAERNITAAHGLGYTLGIVGALMMLTLLLYPLRKRIRFLKFLGSTRRWFYWHMVLGIAGPVLILFHSNFALGSLNSRIALYCTLLVAVSGMVGRYLYSRIHNGLYGRKKTLQALVRNMEESMDQLSKSGGDLIDEIRTRLTELDRRVLEPPQTLLQSAARPLLVSIRTRFAYFRLNWLLRKRLIARSIESQAVAAHRGRLEALTRRYLRRHLRELRGIAHLSLFERLFSYWHILHLPFFLMLVISAIVHVIAVHMY